MVYKRDPEPYDKMVTSEEGHDKEHCLSKTLVRNQKISEERTPRRPRSSMIPETVRSKNQTSLRLKTADNYDRTKTQNLPKNEPQRFANNKSQEKGDKEETESVTSKKGTSNTVGSEKTFNPSSRTERGRNIGSVAEQVSFNSSLWGKYTKKVQKKPSEVSDKGKLSSEIPKLKSIVRRNSETVSPRSISTTQSKLPVKMKNFEEKHADTKPEPTKPEPTKPEPPNPKPESIKMALKSYRAKREAKIDEKIKEAMKDEFSFLVPLYETEFRKITEVWVNTLYCSLMMRSNLIKLLHQVFPQINASQFQTEDDVLFRYITNAKSRTKGDAENLLDVIKALQANREKVKDQYTTGMTNREIAQIYNHDWKVLNRKINDLTEETRQLQLEIPELQKKRELIEANQCNRIREMEMSIEKRNAQINQMTNQLEALKEKEASYKKNIFLKLQDYKDIKADAVSLNDMEKEFREVKAKFATQNETYEAKIRNLQTQLDEKKKILEREKEIKHKLQVFLGHLQNLSIGKEQIEYVMSQPRHTREKRREQLWLAAVKLVLKGFFIQMKKLEKDRNKMLLELQSNDLENFNAVASSLVQKDNFIKTIKTQMYDFQNAYKSMNTQRIENQSAEESSA